ncbi:MAG TPA: transporter substrate-binding domain-containing protein [Vicinamibacteria bacterium]|nr:transporter substrate-binding domain-containing protein [Vicinamibacteria bacterium]
MLERRGVGAAALALLALAGSQASGADLPDIKQQGTIRILTVNEGPEPRFISMQAGPQRGFDREILEGFARAHSLRIDFVFLPSWEGLIPRLLAGDGDMIAGRVTSTTERRKVIDFTNEVFPTRIVIVTRKPQPPVGTREELLAQRIATIKGTAMIEALTAAGVPAAKIDDSFRPGELPGALRARQGLVVAWAVEAAMVAQLKDPDLELGLFLSPPESLAYGVRRGSPRLLAALNDHLGTLRRSGTWNRLVVQYFGQKAPEILAKAREGK